MGGLGHRLLVSLSDALLNQLKYFLALYCLIAGLESLTGLLLEELDGLIRELVGWHTCSHIDVHLESYEGGHESLVFTEEHYVAARGTEKLEVILNWHWCNILTTSSDN